MLHSLNRINVKYALTFVGVALSLWLVVLADALLVNSLRDRLDAFSGPFHQATVAVMGAQRDLYQARSAENEYLRYIPGMPESKAAKASYLAMADQAQQALASFRVAMADYPEVLARAQGFEDSFAAWRQASQATFDYYDDQNVVRATQQIDRASLDTFEALGALLGRASQAVDTRTDQLAAETAGKIARQRLIVGLFAGVVGLVAMAVALVGPHLMARAIGGITGRIRDITDGDGDLTARVNSPRGDEIGDLARAFDAFIERIDSTFQAVRDNALGVHRAADEIALGGQELAGRTEQSAANLQQTSASIEQITTTVRHTAEAAGEADGLAQQTAAVARRGRTAMHKVETTMDEINAASSRINEIVALIDGIAFQTNILALNASVEAARAGEHGRGFAVVAEEVRILAARSGDASRDIRDLVERSASSTRGGVDLVRDAGRTMDEIVAGIEQVTGVIGGISTGAREQSQGIGQVNTAVSELDAMTQHNASLVEESSGAAESMRRQAQELTALIAGFRLSDQHQGADAPAVLESPDQEDAFAPELAA
ncbi:methyl-accepting chemotaxis protein [Alloalcanivorax gelatiniphagus]|uniref:HAMP domain-containing protein n=1 Tax=Alloalcanivorax gelatiniphagus TaxID=1194167 RepID=A0ABY2XK63_9GAMM|nr:methyl-accepting chemotaxis protein [Alloalcanivorax gelatiniphagus]TMW12404.1 HAMP domain-containing protein [Alloalcanivorax gelatiniphagus]